MRLMKKKELSCLLMPIIEEVYGRLAMRPMV